MESANFFSLWESRQYAVNDINNNDIYESDFYVYRKII